jgi:hypothetical protein
MMVTGLLGLLTAGVAAQDANVLAQGFLKPPAADHPAVYAFMMPYGAIPDEVIARDLEEMKAKGVTTCLLYSPGAGVPLRETKLVYGETESRVENPGPLSSPIRLIKVMPQWRRERRNC